MERVTQQYDLYAAEQLAAPGRGFGSQAEIQAWILAEVVGAPWWPERFPNVRTIECPTVRRRPGEGSVGTLFDDGVGHIEMAECHWSERVVLHEIAHVTSHVEGSRSHCPIFARDYLELVYRVMGPEAYVELRSKFTAGGICFDPRCLTKEECQCR